MTESDTRSTTQINADVVKIPFVDGVRTQDVRDKLHKIEDLFEENRCGSWHVVDVQLVEDLRKYGYFMGPRKALRIFLGKKMGYKEYAELEDYFYDSDMVVYRKENPEQLSVLATEPNAIRHLPGEFDRGVVVYLSI